ncbi:fatty acid-binding protein DegV [Lentilactobacillus curieae]|uniref:Fatty acid-binding protein DegV n=1 Tax=Lentilactobacillus curieae TaxID=1138822 RepID=A0A1S6QHL5_9LACO|nr:DegV family protein [Lentilactobacillus curieae]AQW21095.1 fatty acid-binding protein DegV [Lentilactobacillus curieae]
MGKIAIVTDSTAAISESEAAKLGNVFVVPITVTINDQVFREGIDITNEKFYSTLTTLKKLPTTAPPTPQEMLDTYDKLVNAGYDQIISIHLTSGITGFINNLKMIVSGYPKAKVFVFDSHISIEAMGYMVRYASALANSGEDVTNIISKLKDVRASLNEYFVVDDLKNLVTGGRLTNAAAFAGSVLKIKPILTLNDQHEIVAIDKIRTLKKARRFIEGKFADVYQQSNFPLHVILTGTNNASAISDWQAEMKTKFPNATFETGQIGPVVGTHLGSNAFVILWLKQVPELNK